MIPYILGSGVFGPGDPRGLDDRLPPRRTAGIALGMIRSTPHQGEFDNDARGQSVSTACATCSRSLRRDDREHALVGFYGHLAQGMTRDTFIGGEGSRFLHGDRCGRSFYLPPNSASNATVLTTLRYLLVQDWDLDDDGRPETLRLLYGAPGRWLADGAVLEMTRAPSAFGQLSFRAESRLAAGAVTLTIDAPPRRPDAWLVRLPLPPGGRPPGPRSAVPTCRLARGRDRPLGPHRTVCLARSGRQTRPRISRRGGPARKRGPGTRGGGLDEPCHPAQRGRPDRLRRLHGRSPWRWVSSSRAAAGPRRRPTSWGARRSPGTWSPRPWSPPTSRPSTSLPTPVSPIATASSPATGSWNTWIIYSLFLWVFLPYYVRTGPVHRPPVPRTPVQRRVPVDLLRLADRRICRRHHRRHRCSPAGWRSTSMVGLPVAYGIIFFGLVTGAYTIYGGLKSAAWTDFMQILVLGAGGVLVPILGLRQVGGLARLVREYPDKFQVFLPVTHERFPGHRRLHRLPDRGDLVFVHLAAYRPARAGGQGRVQRPDGRGRRGLLHVVTPFFFTVPGIVAFALHPDLPRGRCRVPHPRPDPDPHRPAAA